jgi:hypothetical protein
MVHILHLHKLEGFLLLCYFSFSDINESEFDDKKNFQKYSDESTVEDFAKLEAMTQNWKSPSIGAGYQSLFSIWHY